jgi:hypothetical protein
MKKISLLFVFAAIVSAGANAQYKKASFFTRNGKFYGLKAGLHLFGNGVSATPSIAFIYGKDRGKNRVWHWWDLEYTASSKYSYSTVDYSQPDIKVDVNGKINGMLTWRYNWAFYLRDNKNEEIKGLPFLKIAVEMVLGGRSTGTESYSPEIYAPKKNTYFDGTNGGIDFGAGYTYRLGEKSTLFGVAGYRWILNSDEYQDTFFPNPSHPYINIGIRFSKKSND